jgi:hypothetical protein
VRRAPLLLALLLIALPAIAATAGKANGTMVVSGNATPLKYAYVVEQNTLLKVIVSDRELDDRALANPATIDQVAAIAVQLDESKKAEEVFFFHPDLPAGLSVRELSRFEPKKTKGQTIGGRLILDDKGNSFTYDVTFEAPITHLKEVIDPLPATASKEDHAQWRLQQMGMQFKPEKFRSLILQNDVDAVKVFLEAGMPVETENALTEAVGQGNPAMVKLLIDNGADVNKLDESKGSLVLAATSKPEVLKLLIDAHADVNTPNEYKMAPLAVAAEQGQIESVKMLLAAGAKVNARNPYGGTALQVAVLRGYKDIVKLLIDAGADVKRDRKDLLDLAKDPEIRAMIESAAAKKPR